jgi:quercetin dioxygenase-like cupin family protein
MFKKTLVVAAFAVPFLLAPVLAQQPTVQRKVMMAPADLAAPGYQSAMVLVEIPAGGREGRHTHPGEIFGYVLEGSLTLDNEGKPTTTYKSGDVFHVESGKVHEGINNGGSPAKAIVTFVVEKGKPLASPAP